MRKQIKIAAFAALLAVGFTANAQKKTGDIARKDKGNLKGADRTVRVIDNKGTIKYLQSSNGITTLTNENNGVTTTTWQLGGALENDTYINSAGTVFSLDGLKLLDPTATAAADTATSESVGTNATTISGAAAGTASADTGFTVLVRDEASGEIKKMLFSDFLEVNSVQIEYEVDLNSSPDGGATPAPTTGDVNFFTTTGIALDFVTEYSKVQVYRNGAKLAANRDYKLDATGKKLTLVPNTANPNSNQYWELNDEDFIEVHYTK